MPNRQQSAQNLTPATTPLRPTPAPGQAETAGWYTMVAYRREAAAAEALESRGHITFLPLETIYVKRPHRRPTPVQRPAIPSLLFVNATFSQLLDHKRTVDPRLKFRIDATTGDPLIIPDTQMETFITLWANRDTLSPLLAPYTPTLPTPASPHSTSSTPSPIPGGTTIPTTTIPTGTIPAGTTMEILAGPLAGHLATLHRPLTPRSRRATLTLSLSTLLTITITLPPSSLRPLP